MRNNLMLFCTLEECHTGKEIEKTSFLYGMLVRSL